MMECNKDEALRAKQLAEKKMQSKDFLEAQKFALRAERIYPQLENISQLLTVCNVHCSAQSSTVGPEKDWYRILQIDMTAEKVTIKKQYRKLALVLHPDKNKFPGAEDAFKLIVEANVVLSDPVKKELYDRRYKALSKSTAAKLSRQDHQQTQPASAAFSETFWTRCPSCTERYQSCRGFLNVQLLCRKCLESPRGPQCSHPGDQDVPLRSNISQPYHHKKVPNLGTSKMAADKGGFTSAQMASQQDPSSRTRGSQQGVTTRGLQRKDCSQDIEAKGKDRKYDKGMGGVKEWAAMPKVNNKGRKRGSQQAVWREKSVQLSKDIKAKGKDRKYDKGMSGVKEWAPMPKANNKGRKRGRKQTVESSESIDSLTCTETEAEDIESARRPPLGEGFGRDCFNRRRSSRLRQHVSYNEGASDEENDLASPPKKVRADQCAGDDMSKQKEEALSDDDSNHASPTGFYFDSKEKATQNGTSPPKENVKDKHANIGKFDKQAAGPSLIGVEINDVDNSDSEPNTDPPLLCVSSPSELDTSSSDISFYYRSEPDNDPVIIEYPDPEFGDFDKHREESCFAANQFWACYSNADGMPRYYCQISKVLSPKFELWFTWLEPKSENIKWLEVCCGNFERGTNGVTAKRDKFSHLVKFEESTEGLLTLHPKKGEIWALFRDWDIGWNETKDKYEVVEVLSDFVEGVGIKVNYLDKVNGFVSLFQPTNQTTVASFFVKPNELYKFSHLIPFFKMNGTERNDVPVGSFELDPAALPLKLDSIWYPGKLSY